ncbi:hypothetical protein, partial [Bradyrhizobium sp. SZCCHNRI1002]|uniref:hypothetical protein n=1 Tax=Bradyrhizobium sp. SZCCHNRI1002 TaxID=3057274 RepID=UPI0028E86E18
SLTSGVRLNDGGHRNGQHHGLEIRDGQALDRDHGEAVQVASGRCPAALAHRDAQTPSPVGRSSQRRGYQSMMWRYFAWAAVRPVSNLHPIGTNFDNPKKMFYTCSLTSALLWNAG